MYAQDQVNLNAKMTIPDSKKPIKALFDEVWIINLKLWFYGKKSYKNYLNKTVSSMYIIDKIKVSRLPL